MGRPDRVSLIFDRRIYNGRRHRTEGRFRTRVLTQGVTPSLHVEYKHTRIKQYHKEGRALRTETTINDTRDFWIGKRLCNLPALREVGFSANRRLLHAQTISHDPIIGHTVFHQITQPAIVDGQRSPDCVSAIPESTPSLRPSPSRTYSQPVSPTVTCENTSSRSWGSTLNSSLPGV